MRTTSQQHVITTAPKSTALLVAFAAMVGMVFSTTPGLVSALERIDLPGIAQSTDGTAAETAKPDVAKLARYFVPNGAGQFAVSNTSAGISALLRRDSLVVRTGPDASPITLRSTRLGRAGSGVALTATAAPAATDLTATVRRGATTEWFNNRKHTLEQGWTVSRRPAGTGKLHLDLAIKGGAVKVGSPTGLAVIPTKGAALSYNHLLVHDAAGRKLPAHFVGTGFGARIVVDDKLATYPIVIDPDISSIDVYDPPPSASNDSFGQSVAVDDRWMAVKNIGAPRPGTIAGKGWVDLYFDTTGNGTWVPKGHLEGSEDQTPLGTGLDIVVEPAGVTVLDVTAGGRIEVFTLAGDPITEAPDATPTVSQSLAPKVIAGYTTGTPHMLAAEGNTLVFGSPRSTGSQSRSPATEPGGTPVLINETVGAAQVWKRTGGFGTPYAFVTDLHPAGGLDLPRDQHDFGQFFGNSVALDEANGLIAVGANGDDGVFTSPGGTLADPALPGTSTNNGAVTVFRETAPGTWTRVRRITSDLAPAGASFGFSVTFAGTSGSLLVGAHEETVGTAVRSGAGYLFDANLATNTWTQVQRITGDDPNTPTNEATASGTLGTRVASDPSGQRLYLGAPNQTIGGNGFFGAVIAYARAGSTGPATYQTRLQSPQPSDFHGGLGQQFGIGLAARNGEVAVGAPTFGADEETLVGRVSTFRYAGATYTPTQEISPPSRRGADTFGYALAEDGDVLAISLPNSQRGSFGFGIGAVAIYERHVNDWIADEMLFPNNSTRTTVGQFGLSVAIREYDVAGAHRIDVAVGTPNDSTFDVDSNVQTAPLVPVEAGSVTVYTRTGGAGTAWQNGYKIWAGGGSVIAPDPVDDGSDLRENGRFGTSVAFTADGTLLVGEPDATIGDGIVHRFDRSKPANVRFAWKQQIAVPSTVAEGFGAAIASSGDSVLVRSSDDGGVWRYTDGANPTADGDTAGALTADGHFPMNLESGVPLANQAPVGLSFVGDRFAVGGKIGATGERAVRVYRIVGDVAVREAEFQQPSDSYFGISLDLNHGGAVPTLVAGAPYVDNPGIAGEAFVYVARLNDSGAGVWSEYGQLTNVDPPGNRDGFGLAVTNWPTRVGVMVSAPVSDLLADDNGRVYKYATNEVTPPPGPDAFVDVSLPANVHVGARSVKTTLLPPSLLSNAAAVSGAVAATPIGSIDFSQAPKGTSVSASPLSGIPLSGIPLSGIPLSGIPLSGIPLTVPGGWPAILQGTAFENIPLQSVTLKQVYDLPAVQALPLGALTLAGSPLSSIPVASIALGDTPLSGIDIKPDGSGSNITKWCQALTSAGADPAELGLDCGNPTAGANADVTMLSIGVKGAPLSGIPLSGIPLSGIPLSGIPLSGIPLSGIGISGSPLSGIPLSGIPLSGIPLSGIPLSGIPLSGIPLSGIPLSGIEIGNTPLSGIPLSGIDINGTPLSGIPLSGIPLSGIPLSGIPLSGIPLSGIPLSGIPLSGIPLSGIPLSGIPLSGIPLSGIPLSGIDIGSTPLSGIPLSGIPLSGIPLSGIPLSGIPLSGIPLSGIPLSGISVGGTPLSGIPLSGIEIGNTPLSGIPLSGIGTSLRDTLIDCTAYDCDAPGATIGTAAAAGAIKPGATVGSLSSDLIKLMRLSDLIDATSAATVDHLRSALGSRTLADLSAWGNLTLGDLPQLWPYLKLANLNGLLGGVRLSDIANHLLEFTAEQVREALDQAHLTLANITGWDDVTLGQVGVLLEHLHLSDLSTSLKGIRLGDLAGAIHKPGGGTYSAQELRDAVTQALPGATFGDLTDLGDLTLGELGTYGNTTLGQLLTALSGSDELDRITFGDLLLTLMNPKQYPWESLDLNAVAAQAYDEDPIGSPVNLAYRADAPDGLPRTVRVKVQLPHGARIALGSIEGDSYGSTSELTPVIDGDVATWTFTEVPANAPQSLTFDMQAPLNIGPAQVKATAFLPADDQSGSDTASSVVSENYEPNNTIATATALPDDTIQLSHISAADDVDVYKFTVAQPGTRVAISLSNLDADLDMVLYSPAVGSVQPTAGKHLDPTDDGAGSGVPGQDQAGTYTPQPSAGNDVKAPADLGSLAVVQGSFNRGRTNEQIDTRVLTRTGTYYLAVTGYNAAVDTQPYALRLKRFVNTEQPACPARPVASGVQGTLLPQSLPAGTDTVFVVNRSRMAGLYGDAAADTLMDQLTSFTGWVNTSGQQNASILTVDADAGVRAAYSQWDASPCVPSGANGVVSEIARILNGYRAGGATLKNVVLVGGDDAVPFARVPDRTEIANESGYASTFSNAGNALYATFATSNVQTDNAYVDRSPYAFGDRTLYVPDTTIGRLVESPGEITDQLADFRDADGKLAVGTGLVTGYDFLTDGSEAIKDEVTRTYGTVTSKISDTWTRQDLEDAIHAIKPDLLSVNAHFDHQRALPAAGNATHDETDLFQAAAVRGALNGDLAGSVVFSMGCHGGLSASDNLVTGDLALDFAQAVSSQGGVFVGNTGFGYGDTETIALSEQLMGDFAQRLDGSMTVGDALLYAKNAYFSSLAEYTPYDEKVLAQTTFYGLPFYRLDVPNPPSVPAPVSALITPDAATGLDAATTHLAPTHANRTADNGTTYVAAVDPVTGEDVVTTVQNRPVQPKVDTEYALPAGRQAHDGLVLGMSSVDAPGTDPYVFQPIVDDSGEQVNVGVDTAFPTRAVRVNSGLTPAGETFHVAATTGYFRTTAADGKGIQRTYQSMDVQTYLAPTSNSDWTAPTFSQVSAQVHDGVISVSAHVMDDQGNESRVKRVRLLLLQDPRAGVTTAWRGLDLVRTAGSDEWTGSLPSNGRNLEFVLQAVDAAGNVGITNDRAQNFNDDTIAGGTSDDGGTPITDLLVSLSGTQGSENWYTGPVTVTASGGSRLVYEVIGENAPTGYQEPFVLSDTGLHTVRVTSGDGQEQTVTIPIDRVGPVATLSSPAPGQSLPAAPGALITYSCPDAGSGGTTCSAFVDSSPIPVASGTTLVLAPGSHTVKVYAGPDRAGNPASVPTLTRTFTVLGAPATVGTIGVTKAQDGAVTTLTIPFTGYSVLTYSGTVNWGDGGSTNCVMAGSGCTITRNSSGGGTLTVTHTYNTAWVDTTATVTVVDNLGQTASATTKVNKKTTLSATAALLQLKVTTNIIELKSGAISATLKDGTGNPLSGQSVKFTLPSGTTLCTATTNASGVAACPTNLVYTVAMILAGRYNATFAGKDAFHGSSASASLIG